MTLSAGSQIGSYGILGPLGSGGMGEVYRARDARLGREVALKVLPDVFAGDPDRLARFHREAQVLASLNHPNIAQIHGLEEAAGVRALVMELVEGPTLDQLIADAAISRGARPEAGRSDTPRSGGLPIDDSIAIARQIAEALEAAHERGIIHRDLKPANVKVRADGTVKVLDFGLAKALDADGGLGADIGNSPTLSARGTRAGTILGTAAYMAPEQARGRPVDTRADIWSFGVVLFEMLAGRRPFSGEDVADALAEILKSQPGWDALPAATPAAVRRLLRRCLDKDPRRRLQHIGDARFELEEAREADVPGSAAPARRERQLLPWIVAGAAMLVAAVALGALLISPSSPEMQAAMRFVKVTSFSGVEAQPSFSPDARSVAFVSNRDGQWDIYVGLVSGGSPIRITNDPNVETRPRWSPDGSRILFSRLNDAGGHDVWVVPALGGTARRILGDAIHPAWSPDGRTIAYSSGGAISIADANGANPRVVTKPGAFPADYQAAFSRDGRSLAFIRRRGGGPAFMLSGPYGALMVLDLATQTLRQLTEDDALALSPAWSPDDRYIYFAWSRGGALNIWKIPAAGGEPLQITAGQGDDAELDLSAGGERLVFSSARVNVNLAEIGLEGSGAGRLTLLTSDSTRGENRPTYSPDGRRIAYFSNRVGAERESIWVMDADGRNAARLVEEEDRVNIFPRWASGHELLFLSRSALSPLGSSLVETSELRRLSINGGASQPLPVKPWSPSWGDIAADGRIIYRSGPETGEIYDPKMERRIPVAGLLGDPLWSRDGRSFGFVVPNLGDPPAAGVWIATPQDRPRQVFAGWVVAFSWTYKGEVLVLEGKPHLSAVLWRVDPSSGRKELVLDKVPLFLAHTNVLVPPLRFDVHPDGRRIVIEALESFEADIGMIENVR